jgi:Ni,Fe-hydrogenase I large subunit
VNYHDPSQTWVKRELDSLLASLSIPIATMSSVLGRHVARGFEAYALAKQTLRWLDELDLDGPPATPFSIPRQATGYGLCEAPRGAIGHWLSIVDYRIERYQCIVPTTWNCSPRDDQGHYGPVEQALLETLIDDPEQPIEIGRIVRSFDPCIACAVH